MTTLSTDMSKNAGPDLLAQELAAMPDAIKDAQDGRAEEKILLARLIPGLSLEKWRSSSANRQLSQWHAIPADAISENDLEEMDWNVGELCITPFRETGGALTKDMFLRLLKRELSRMNRTGGDMSLLGIAMTDRSRLMAAIGAGAVARLESILGLTVLSMLEGCDSLGILRKGQYLCLLPGFGQLAARNFAEKCQMAFYDAARPFFPTGGISAGSGADCAIGIISIPQGEKPTAKDLLKRAKSSLEIALDRPENHIYQEASALPMENATLVQSSEKRFLFFGGQTS